MSTPAPVPAGAPTGGRFAVAPRRESDIDLDGAHLRTPPQADPTVSSAQALLASALAERMDMSDDHRVSARLRELEQAVAAEIAATPQGRRDAAERKSASQDLRRRVLDAEFAASKDRARARDYLRSSLTTAATDRSRDARSKSPEEIAKRLSAPSLTVALNSLRRAMPTREGMRRISVIESEIELRSRAGAV